MIELLYKNIRIKTIKKGKRKENKIKVNKVTIVIIVHILTDFYMEKWLNERRMWLFGNNLPLLPRRYVIIFTYVFEFVNYFVKFIINSQQRKVFFFFFSNVQINT